MAPAAAGKDSITGHWELMGLPLGEPFATFPDGFPAEIIDSVEGAIGRKTMGNRAASGTGIIQELGDEHVRNGRPIIYTSQDSVFQIAAHQDVVALQDLYAFCGAARDIVAPHRVARVIARPFAGQSGGYYRTPDRKDFAVPPHHPTLLDALQSAEFGVLTVGKIADLFSGRGIERSIATSDNHDGMRRAREALGQHEWSFVFTNLVDFDTMWGHRNDARAYALGLEEFDSYLGGLVQGLNDDTLLIVTSDHGNDPTTPSTDHSREWVPLIVYHNRLNPAELGDRSTLADVGKTIAENFAVAADLPGTSFLDDILKGEGGKK